MGISHFDLNPETVTVQQLFEHFFVGAVAANPEIAADLERDKEHVRYVFFAGMSHLHYALDYLTRQGVQDRAKLGMIQRFEEEFIREGLMPWTSSHPAGHA